MNTPRNARKTFIGKVVSDKMEKTIVVRVDSVRKHPKYDKSITKTKKYKVHNPENKAKLGDIVEITECRPLSRTKRWRLSNIISSQMREFAKAELEAKEIEKKVAEQIEIKKEEQLGAEKGPEITEADNTSESAAVEESTSEAAEK